MKKVYPHIIVIQLMLIFLNSGTHAQQLQIIGNAKITGKLDLAFSTYQDNVAGVAIGLGAGIYDPGDRYSVFLGYKSGNKNLDWRNTAFGSESFSMNETGNTNASFGYRASYQNNSSWNTAIGSQSLENNLTGKSNTALGYKSGFNNLTGNQNIFIGSQAGRDQQSGNHNIYIGQGSGLERPSGGQNLIIGHSAGRTGSGSNNVFIGDNAGRINQGNNNVFIGYSAAVNLSIGSNVLWIENSSNATPLIFGEFVNDRVGINCTNPQATLSVVGDIYASGPIMPNENLTCTSDANFKKKIVGLESSLHKLNLLRPVRYTFRKDISKAEVLSQDEQIGLIAQEVEDIYPEIVYTGADGYKSLDYSRLTVVLSKAVQELSENIDHLQILNQVLDEKLDLIEKETNF